MLSKLIARLSQMLARFRQEQTDHVNQNNTRHHPVNGLVNDPSWLYVIADTEQRQERVDGDVSEVKQKSTRNDFKGFPTVMRKPTPVILAIRFRAFTMPHGLHHPRPTPAAPR